MSDATKLPSQKTGFVEKVFLEHPASVDETFWEHFRFAMTFGFWLALAACAAFIHALVPALCKTTGSDIICKLHARIVNRVTH
ncbi:MAG: hypothetical protein HRT60_03130 [Dinoroseobacter sp.]|nr:hypothetical protein [Dinoroseobacter sp.]NQZ72039.1 hypothetical protein [Dinoroseobacter sp.]